MLILPDLLQQDCGPGMPVVLKPIHRPGRTRYAGFYRVIEFIGRRDNLHRFNGSAGADIGEEKVLMKRKLERSILFRKYKQQEEANGRTSCSERFFYEVSLGHN